MKPIHWAAIFAVPLLAIVVGFVAVQRAFAPADSADSTDSAAPAAAVAPSMPPPAVSSPSGPSGPSSYRAPFTGLSVERMMRDFSPLVVSRQEDRTDDGLIFRVYRIDGPTGQIQLIGPDDDLRDLSFSVLVPFDAPPDAPPDDQAAIRLPLGALILAARAAVPGWSDADSANWVRRAFNQVLRDIHRPIAPEENPHHETDRLRLALIGIPTRQGLMLSLTIARKDDPR